MRARAEMTRLAFALGNIPYEDIRLDFGEQWAKEKACEYKARFLSVASFVNFTVDLYSYLTCAFVSGHRFLFKSFKTIHLCDN